MSRPRHNSDGVLHRAFDDCGIGGNAKHVFLHMCRRGNGTGLSYMTKKTLAGATGLSLSTITRSLKTLRESRRIVFVRIKPGTCAPEYSLQPGGHSAREPKSGRSAHAGQIEPQNPNRNPKVNQFGAVESLGISARAKSAVQVGNATHRILGNISSSMGSGVEG